MKILLSALVLLLGMSIPQPLDSIVIDDFESYSPGGLPVNWKYLHKGEVLPVAPEHMRERERFFVVDDSGNKSLRAYSEGEAVHLVMNNEEDGFDWNMRDYPVLAWDWRAHNLPAGAREDNDRLNDSGAGVYVIFAMEGFIVKRPKSIKYVYSTQLPVGTIVSYGKLKVIVAASGQDGGMGEWTHIERDVMKDYRAVFGGRPPSRPLAIRLWSDSDNTGDVAKVDFDNIELKTQ